MLLKCGMPEQMVIDKMDNNNMESLMNVGIAMIGIGEKCKTITIF